MRRITKADINFTLDTKLIKVDDFSIKFYTVNPTNFYISKNQDNVIQDGDNYVIKLDWNELVTIGEGVLEYRAINNTLDNGFVDNYYNKSVERTTEYYINSDVVVDEDEAKNYGELLAELGQDIAAEVSTRQQNVSDLTDLNNAERDRAISAETSLKSDIDNEARLRKYSITNVENSISGLTDDVNGKIDYISGVTDTKADKTQLNNYYTKAEVDKKIDDIDVSDQINAERDRAISAETALKADIDSEARLRKYSITNLENRLDDYLLVSAFTEAEQSISASLNDLESTKAEKTDLDTKYNYLDNKIKEYIDGHYSIDAGTY